MYSFWSFFTRKAQFSTLLVITLIVVGVFSVLQMERESAPEVQVPVAIVNTTLPAASAEDVEQLVTDPIETHLDSNLQNVDTITSTSREGVSSITVEFNAAADIDESVRSVKDELGAGAVDLPEDASTPNVTDVNFASQPIMTVSFTSKRPLTEFVSLAEQLESRIEEVDGVADVTKSGVRERAVNVVVDITKLHQYDLNLSQVVAAISSANSGVPVGSLMVDGNEYSLQFEGDIDAPQAVRDIPVTTRGNSVVHVSDIGFVSVGLQQRGSYSRLSVDGGPAKQAATFSITKTSDADVTRVSERVRSTLDQLQDGLLAGSETAIVFDSGGFVWEDLTRLSLTGLQTIALVMLILFVALGWREALVAGMAIPLSFLIAFIGLNATGNTLNFVSLFSLILAVGILVDSAIVMTESIHTKLYEGSSQIQAALESIKEFHTPLTAGVMTTVAVFFPLFFISGVTGRFIATIPYTVIMVLLASLLVALAVVPLSSSWLLARDQEQNGFADTIEHYTRRFQMWYRDTLDTFLRDTRLQNTAMMMLCILLVISLLLPAIGGVSVIFFPEEDSDFFFVEMELPTGTTLQETNKHVQSLEDVLRDTSYIVTFNTTVGALSSFREGTQGTQYANITTVLADDRDRSSAQLRQQLVPKLTNAIPARADLRVFEQASGPPTGSPINIRFSGDSLEAVSTAVENAKQVLDRQDGAVNPQTNLKQAGIDFVLEPDRDAIARRGVSVSTVAQNIRTAVAGTEATTLRTDGDDQPVMVRAGLNPDYQSIDETNRAHVSAINKLPIQTQAGEVYLGSLIENGTRQRNAVIRHRDLDRTAAVSAETAENAVTSDVLNAFRNEFDESMMPDGVSMSFGGEQENVNQSFRDMFLALIYGMLLILAILMLQFNSLRDMLYIIGIVPFLLVGILVGLAITGLPLSFPSIMGFIALAGIVVNNSIILVDTMNQLKFGQEYNTHSLKEAVLDGAEKRLRPVVLTTVTTVIGVIPLTYASALWGPLAFAIIFGLSFSLILTLFMVPMVYYRWPGTAD